MSTDNTAPSPTRALTEDELDAVTGGQQLYAHEFPGAVNQLTGLRPFEPPIGKAVMAWSA